MSENLNRRSFLKKSITASTTAALGLSLEEKTLLAAEKKPPVPKVDDLTKAAPMGKIGNLKISRLIAGGNLINGFAHARDLIYVSNLIKSYHTDEKIMETWQTCEENGINTMISTVDSPHARGNDPTLRVINKYRKERGGQIQWIAQCTPKANDLTTNIKIAVDNGAVGAFTEGTIADNWVKHKRVDLIAEVISFIRQNGLIAGVGGHFRQVPMALEEAGIKPDFYMKTLHHRNYWSATPKDRKTAANLGHSPFDHDNIWSRTPEKTIEFMKNVNVPWFAYKVLAAGAIHPSEGFKYAFENGADFICVGMFDFQVTEDVLIAKQILAGNLNRQRPWRA